MEAIRSSETSVLTKTTRRQIPEDDFLHSHRRENLKSYILQNSMEPEGSLPFLQELSIGPYPEPDESRPYHPILFPWD
jgi:hypothetical protein